MARILMIYGTTYGQTEKVMRRMAHSWSARGHDVTVYQASALPGELTLNAYDACVMAASVRYGRHQASVRDVVRGWAPRLNAMPSAFVSVCGAMGGGSVEGARRAVHYVEVFLRETGWCPSHVTSVAGALMYTRYGLFTRWIMRFISKRTGRPTDTRRDYEFTDWDAVEAFAQRFAAALPRPAPACAVELRT